MVSTDGIRCMLMRGGSSKGAYFVKGDLPTAVDERDRALMSLMGSPDNRQIDGIGGAHPLTSKVAVISISDRADADLDYLFLQVAVDEPVVTDRQNCGNLLAGVAPFAIERGLLKFHRDVTSTQVRIHLCNTDARATATVAMADGRPVYDGDTAISGVPGTAAPIFLDFEDLAGSTTGALLPTGTVKETIAGVDCTLIDNGMPVVVLRADAVGIAGDESCTQLESDDGLRSRLENIRLEAGKLMGLGPVGQLTIPKITMVSKPRQGGALCTRTFIPHRCHQAIGVLGAVSVATAALLAGSTASEVVVTSSAGVMRLEHPSGFFDTAVELGTDQGMPMVERAGIIRTARKLFDGVVFPRTA